MRFHIMICIASIQIKKRSVSYKYDYLVRSDLWNVGAACKDLIKRVLDSFRDAHSIEFGRLRSAHELER